uniref:Nudix hydrolase domain-containing protein n=1 Tax=Hemiselmis tepida TaxID=464990 RepID=A0A7S0YNN9_9CRYP
MATAVMGAADGMMGSMKKRKGRSQKGQQAAAPAAAPAGVAGAPLIPGTWDESQLLAAAAAAQAPPPPASGMNLALDDLASRFILNCPAETARDEMMLLMFEVEKAFWFYLDFWREHDTSLPSLGMRDFSHKLFGHCAMLQPYAGQLDTILTKWNAYKREVPTFGAVILDESLTKVLLVRGWNSKTWGWPKGKVNKDEDQIVCAAREVQEEIGFDVSPYLRPDWVISLKVGEVVMKLFVAAGVPESTYFETQTRKEISEIKWHNLKDLGKDSGPKLFSVMPVLGRLKSWIAQYRQASSRSGSRAKTPPKAAAQEVAAANASPHRATSGKKGKKGAEEGRRVPKAEMDAAGVTRNNEHTFGGNVSGFSAEDMFRVNEELTGRKSSYKLDLYTTKLGGSGEAAGAKAEECMYAERYRPMEVAEAAREASGATTAAGSQEHSDSSPTAGPDDGKSRSFDGFRLDAGAIMGAMTF